LYQVHRIGKWKKILEIELPSLLKHLKSMIKIGGLQKLTLIDYPGNLACTVFLSGCNFRCPFCYSAELVLPEKIARQPEISQKYFFDFLKQRKGQLDGVVICGGEPTINPDLPNFCSQIKKMGYKVKLDTNGSNPFLLAKILKNKLLDYVAMDIKAPQEKYAQMIGFDGCHTSYLLNKIQKSIDLLKNGAVDYEFRTTFVPGLHTKDDISAIVRWLKPAKRFYLQNFRPEKTLDPNLSTLRPYQADEMAGYLNLLTPFFETAQIR